MDLRGRVLRGHALDALVDSGTDLRGSDFRDANLSDADLTHVDLRGCDLRGADLHEAQHLALSELVGYRGGEWVPLAAWDRKTRFPEEFEEKLWVLGLRYRGYSRESGHKFTAIKRGLKDAERRPMDKEHEDYTEVVPLSGCDG